MHDLARVAKIIHAPDLGTGVTRLTLWVRIPPWVRVDLIGRGAPLGASAKPTATGTKAGAISRFLRCSQDTATRQGYIEGRVDNMAHRKRGYPNQWMCVVPPGLRRRGHFGFNPDLRGYVRFAGNHV